jgi:hypothetical protein
METMRVHRIARSTLASVWIYQGLVPKLLCPDTGELEIFRSTGLYPGRELAGIAVLGLAQTLLGLWHAVDWNSRAPLRVGIVMLGVLGIGGLITRPDLFILPFNPASMIVMMLALSAIDGATLETAT